MSDRKPLVVAEGLYKIFGPSPQAALELLRQGLGKADIFERTGATIGVQDASFTVRQGEVFVVMGLSGSGKSTLLRMINRLIEPTAGKVFIGDREVTAMRKKELIRLRREEMSMVFQSFALLPHLTVAQNAGFGLDIARIPKRQRRDRALRALEQVGLAAYADSYPDELSGGMRQRVGLARALAAGPSLMLMDEAFSALDPLIRAEMQEELLKLQRERERTIIFISHDLDEAMKIGDRIAIMESGRVLQVGKPEEILKYPADEYVRSFFGGVDVSNVFKAGDLARMRARVMLHHRATGGVRVALQRLREHDQEFGYVRGDGGRFLGVVSVDSLLEALRHEHTRIEEAFLDVEPVHESASFDDAVRRAAHSPCALPVVDDRGRYLGTISKTMLLETLEQRAERKGTRSAGAQETASSGETAEPPPESGSDAAAG